MAFKKLVVATDGSDNAHRAVRMASDIAATYGAKLYILHCVLAGAAVPKELLHWARVEHLVEGESTQSDLPEWPGYGNLGVIGPNRERWVSYQARLQLGRAILDEAMARARETGVKDIEEVFEEGDAANAVMTLVNREGINLAVTGTRGLGVIDQMLVGSISHKLISMGRVPVLTVP